MPSLERVPGSDPDRLTQVHVNRSGIQIFFLLFRPIFRKCGGEGDFRGTPRLTGVNRSQITSGSAPGYTSFALYQIVLF